MALVITTMSGTIRPNVNGSQFPILRLPNGILSHILYQVIDMERDYAFDPNAPPKTAVRLSNTCQRIRNTLIPEIYSVFHIDLIPKTVTQSLETFRKSTSRLNEIMKDNPEWRKHCKTLRIRVYDTISSLVPLERHGLSESMLDAIGWLRNARHLVICGIENSNHYLSNYIGVDGEKANMFNDYVATIINSTLTNLPGLTTLSLKANCISLPAVLDAMRDRGKCHNLSTLVLGTIASFNNAERWDHFEELEGTATIKNLDLQHFCLQPEALEVLVRWPMELHKLSVRPSEYQLNRDKWTCMSLQPIIETQMANLRELAMYDLRLQDNIEILDLTGFTMLERLSLPAMLTGLDKRHIPRIVAPNLRYFRWQVGYHDFEDELFGDKHEEWVCAMVEFAARQQQKLKTIFIALECHDFDGFLDGTSDYPWDALDDINRNSSKFGIYVRYDEPFLSRDDFEQHERTYISDCFRDSETE